jgi:hypothetical protein
MRQIPSTIDTCEAFPLDLNMLRLHDQDQYRNCHAKVVKYVHEVMPDEDEGEIAAQARLRCSHALQCPVCMSILVRTLHDCTGEACISHDYICAVKTSELPCDRPNNISIVVM